MRFELFGEDSGVGGLVAEADETPFGDGRADGELQDGGFAGGVGRGDFAFLDYAGEIESACPVGQVQVYFLGGDADEACFLYFVAGEWGGGDLDCLFCAGIVGDRCPADVCYFCLDGMLLFPFAVVADCPEAEVLIDVIDGDCRIGLGDLGGRNPADILLDFLADLLFCAVVGDDVVDYLERGAADVVCGDGHEVLPHVVADDVGGVECDLRAGLGREEDGVEYY
ncbi:MAG: hypothetical protein HDS36_00955 [Bacteroides sp.]|nr:hypothetical protein [Bacteroides sp.]